MISGTGKPATVFQTCNLCPRNCGVDRVSGSTGFCGEKSELRIALACLHFGEEPVLTGARGSGTVFFTGCTLRCEFCQNCQVSRGGLGKVVEADEFSDILLALQVRGAENINFVTGTQFAPLIAEGVQAARGAGLAIPVLWNTSGYENRQGIDIINSFTDVYLPDLKTLDPQTAISLFKAPDYPERATESIQWMAEKKPLKYGDSGMLERGTIVRHLVLPGGVDDTRRVIDWFAAEISGKALLSIMFQYLPPADMSEGSRSPDRGVDEVEYCQVIAALEGAGIQDGFVQDLGSESAWLPDFNRENPFPDTFADSVWHWKYGFMA